MKLELYKEIRSYIKTLITNTKFEGKTYCVGGCCRDEILGNDIKDIDIVIELENGGIDFATYLYEKHLTKGNVRVFQRFGTAMFILKKYPNIEIEVVHTRCEKYLDGTSRNPITDFGTIHEDCYRRDLTINCLYYNISEEKFYDFCGYSLDHIKNHIICTPYNPDVTYSDDPLRILRCVRFATRYGWNIENQTYQALKRNVNRLYIITDERITDEFMKIISDKNYFHGLNLLEDIGALDYILTPIEIRPNHYKPKFYEYHSNLMVSPLLDNANVRLAVLMFPYMQYTEQILKKRKLPNINIKYICNLSNLAKKYLNLFDKANLTNLALIRRCQYQCKSKKIFNDLIKILITLNPSLRDLIKVDFSICNHFNYELPIDGQDVMKYCNLDPSKEVKEILSDMLDISFTMPSLSRDSYIEILKKYNKDRT